MTDPEIEAMTALGALDDAARGRVLRWAAERFGETPPPAGAPVASPDAQELTFAEVYEAYGPRTDPERALVAAYWMHAVQGRETFVAAELNWELKEVGHSLGNVTDAVTSGLNRGLLVQHGKTGETQQSRKVLGLTDAGVRAVRARL